MLMSIFQMPMSDACSSSCSICRNVHVPCHFSITAPVIVNIVFVILSNLGNAYVTGLILGVLGHYEEEGGQEQRPGQY